MLIADFFFILAALGWFLAGLAEKSAVQTTVCVPQSRWLLLLSSTRNGVCIVQRLLDTWFFLWPLVFQPALGVLMLGAVRHPLHALPKLVVASKRAGSKQLCVPAMLLWYIAVMTASPLPSGTESEADMQLVSAASDKLQSKQ